MGASFEFTPYRFVLPQLKKQYLGTQGQLAQYIPYRLEKDLTPEAIRAELTRIPHMARLAEQLDLSRRLYLLHSSDLEALLLAAEYIGTFFRLSDPDSCAYRQDFMEDEAEEAEEWRDGDPNFMTFDFNTNLPYVDACEVSAIYGENTPDFGFAGQFYRPEASPRRAPWWTMSKDAPLCVAANDILTKLAGPISAMAERSPVIILCHIQSHHDMEEVQLDFDYIADQRKLLAELAFDLETELIQLDASAADSPYRREILLQLAAQAGAPLDKPEDGGTILNLIANYCGDASNATLSKAVQNALLRRKESGPLTVQDFQYLAVLFESRENRRSIWTIQNRTLYLEYFIAHTVNPATAANQSRCGVFSLKQQPSCSVPLLYLLRMYSTFTGFSKYSLRKIKDGFGITHAEKFLRKGMGLKPQSSKRFK